MTFFIKRKIPLIPPLPVNNIFVTDFKNKDNSFTEFFSKQCTPVANDSSLPPLPEGLINESYFKMGKKLNFLGLYYMVTMLA